MKTKPHSSLRRMIAGLCVSACAFLPVQSILAAADESAAAVVGEPTVRGLESSVPLGAVVRLTLQPAFDPGVAKVVWQSSPVLKFSPPEGAEGLTSVRIDRLPARGLRIWAELVSIQDGTTLAETSRVRVDVEIPEFSLVLEPSDAGPGKEVTARVAMTPEPVDASLFQFRWDSPSPDKRRALDSLGRSIRFTVGDEPSLRLHAQVVVSGGSDQLGEVSGVFPEPRAVAGVAQVTELVSPSKEKAPAVSDPVPETVSVPVAEPQAQVAAASEPVPVLKAAEPAPATVATPEVAPRSPANTVQAPVAGTIPPVFDNWNSASVDLKPRNPTRFHLQAPTQIASIRTHHYNKGQGARPGTIALRRSDGVIFGPWKAVGIAVGAVSNAVWEVQPNYTLTEGAYSVLDSDPATWSHNAQSRGEGFVQIKAAEPDSEEPAWRPTNLDAPLLGPRK